MSNRTGSARAWRVVPAVAAGVLISVAALSPGCKGVEVQTLQPIVEPSAGNIGDPCLPHDESSPTFTGWRVVEENIETYGAACNSGVCLVNHVQGRATCPLGQDAPPACAGPNDTSCGSGFSCVAAGQNGPWCYFTSEDGGAPVLDASICASGVCNDSPRNTCQCTSDAQCPEGTACDAVTRECTSYVCHRAGDCQSADATDAENAGKSCCVGADVPVRTEVCGQCEKGSGRNAAEDIYCSCRCGPADGDAPDGSAYCACPGGFECSQIRPNVGIGDPELTGKYCIRSGTAYTGPGQCGAVSGNLASQCEGTPAN